MPKTIFLPPDDGPFRYGSGIDITWYSTSRDIEIGGWYDGCVGIESTRMGLREFFDMLGIKKSDCDKVWR